MDRRSFFLDIPVLLALAELMPELDAQTAPPATSGEVVDFWVKQMGVPADMLVGGPAGRPLRKNEEGFPVISISGYIGIGDSMAASNLDNSKTAQVVDNITWVHGVHTFKFGADIRRNLDDATTNNWPFGSLTFTSDIANNSAAAFMLGFPRTVLTPEGVPITAARQWRMGFYGQDDWKKLKDKTPNVAPDEAILAQAKNGAHDLIVMGVQRRPGNELFFGDTAASVFAKSPGSVLFLSS